MRGKCRVGDMVEFEFTVKDPMGLHARPAGRIVKEAAKFKSRIVLEANGKSVEATRLLALMGLRTKQGTSVKVSVEGEDEIACAEAFETLCAEMI